MTFLPNGSEVTRSHFDYLGAVAIEAMELFENTSYDEFFDVIGWVAILKREIADSSNNEYPALMEEHDKVIEFLRRVISEFSVFRILAYDFAVQSEAPEIDYKREYKLWWTKNRTRGRQNVDYDDLMSIVHNILLFGEEMQTTNYEYHKS